MKKLILLLFIPLVFDCGNDSKKEKENEEKGIADKLCNCLKEDVNNWNKFANGVRINSQVMDIIKTENLGKCEEYWEEMESLDGPKFEEIDAVLNSCPYSIKWAEILDNRFECPDCIAEKYY